MSSDLSNNQMPQDHTKQPPAAQRPKPSAWVRGAEIAAIFTVGAAAGILIGFQTARAELIRNLVMGSAVSFLVWWLLITGVVSIGRRAGKIDRGRHALVFGVIILILLGGFFIILVVNGNIFSGFASTPTPAAAEPLSATSAPQVLLQNSFALPGPSSQTPSFTPQKIRVTLVNFNCVDEDFYLDGHLVKTMKVGETIVFTTTPGTHTVKTCSPGTSICESSAQVTWGQSITSIIQGFGCP